MPLSCHNISNQWRDYQFERECMNIRKCVCMIHQMYNLHLFLRKKATTFDTFIYISMSIRDIIIHQLGCMNDAGVVQGVFTTSLIGPRYGMYSLFSEAFYIRVCSRAAYRTMWLQPWNNVLDHYWILAKNNVSSHGHHWSLTYIWIRSIQAASRLDTDTNQRGKKLWQISAKCINIYF